MTQTVPPTPPWMPTPDAVAGFWQGALTKMLASPKIAAAIRRVRVGVTPSRPVYREDTLRLLRYETDVEQRFDTPLLFVFALVNRPYILDLRSGKSVVSHFVNAGFDTYNIDWGKPNDGDRQLGLEDYVLTYMDNCVDRICERTGQSRVNLLGYCMGGSMSVMYAALRPEKIRNLVLMAAPVDWSARDNLLSVWTEERYFDVDKMLEVYGNAPAGWLQLSFQMLRPVQNFFEKWVGFSEKMDDEKFLEDFFAMETWLNDNIPVAGETFRQFVKYCFQRNLLIQNKLEIGDERIDLRNVRAPLLNLIAQHDHLVTPSQSHPLNDAVGSTDRKTITFPSGHIGLAVSGKAHRELWPKVVQWLEERSDSGTK